MSNCIEGLVREDDSGDIAMIRDKGQNGQANVYPNNALRRSPFWMSPNAKVQYHERLVSVTINPE